ncbi:phosphatidyl inositol kinase, partial [Rhizophlyctis rosea]
MPPSNTPSPSSTTTPAAAAAARALFDSALQSAAETVARANINVGSNSKRSKKNRPKMSKTRGAYAPLSSSSGGGQADYSMDDVSTPGTTRAGSSPNGGYFQLGGEDDSSDYDSDMEASFSSQDRLVHTRQNTPHINGTPIRPDVPSIMDLPGEPSFTGPSSYTDSLVPLPPDFTNPVQSVTPLSDADFFAMIDEVKAAIAEGIHPTLIAQGSSGSYFCRNRKGEIIGVFKPKNEEPYGHLNPKWTKWIHRNLFPCCFGRSCIIPNLGYISEAAASYIDRRLGLNVTPRTEVVLLASPTFYYSRKDWRAYRQGKPLPEKMGSFQTFLRGYKDATQFFREGYEKVRETGGSVGQDRASGWSERAKREFQWRFERLVVLDYLVRQTDRGLDNWMIKWDDGEERREREGAEGAGKDVEVEKKGDPLISVDGEGKEEGLDRAETAVDIGGDTSVAESTEPAARVVKVSIANVTPPSSPPLTPVEAETPPIPLSDP